jgi:hypothetical protein
VRPYNRSRELRDRRKDPERRSVGRCRGVDGLAACNKVDPEHSELLGHVDA